MVSVFVTAQGSLLKGEVVKKSVVLCPKGQTGLPDWTKRSSAGAPVQDRLEKTGPACAPRRNPWASGVARPGDRSSGTGAPKPIPDGDPFFGGRRALDKQAVASGPVEPVKGRIEIPGVFVRPRRHV